MSQSIPLDANTEKNKRKKFNIMFHIAMTSTRVQIFISQSIPLDANTEKNKHLNKNHVYIAITSTKTLCHSLYIQLDANTEKNKYLNKNHVYIAITSTSQ